MCSKEQANSLTEGMKKHRFYPFLLCHMETLSHQPEIGNQLRQHVPRLTELGMEVLKRQRRDPDVDIHNCHDSVEKLSSTPPHHFLKKTWEYPVYDETKARGDRRVYVEYVHRTEIPGHNETDTLTLELRINSTRSACGAILCACGAILEKQASQPVTDFQMTGITVLSRENGRRLLTLKADTEVMQDSEILSAMEDVLREIIIVLERAIVGPEHREAILGPIQKLLRVS